MKFEKVLRFGTFFLAVFIWAIRDWTQAQFGVVYLDQILFHLLHFESTALVANRGLLSGFVEGVILVPLLVGLVLTELSLPSRRSHALWRSAWARLGHRRCENVAPIRQNRGRAFSIGLLTLSVALLVQQFNVSAFVVGFFGDDYFARHYLRPETVPVAGSRPKSLVLIYVESLESTYSDPQAFGRDLLGRLSQYRQAQVSFDDFVQLPGAGWTIAGIVASQCGIPLKPPSIFLDLDEQTDRLSGFLPNATCLSDILAAHGYHNVFMGGAPLRFSGKGRFLKDHRYEEVYGKDEWQARGYDPRQFSDWGLHDDDLLHEARKKLESLMASRQLFNLTLLTVDTHFPKGHPSPTCLKREAEEFSALVECTADQVADFIGFIEQHGWLDRVQVVVMGDHLSMKNTVYDKLLQARKRTVFNLFVSNQRFGKATETISHFDMLPTVLEFVGFEIEGHQLALGHSAFVPSAQLARSPRPMSEMGRSLLNFSRSYLELWSSPRTQVPAVIKASN